MALKLYINKFLGHNWHYGGYSGHYGSGVLPQIHATAVSDQMVLLTGIRVDEVAT